MALTTAALEVHVHLEDGRVAKFATDEDSVASTILNSIQPTRLFSHPLLLIGGDHSLSAFPASRVVRVDLLAALLPNWPFHYGAIDILQVTEDEFKQKFRPSNYANVKAGQPVEVFAETELVNGERIFLQIEVAALQERTPLELNLFLQHLISAGGFHARRHSGGLLILNPTNIVRLTFHPGPRDIPPLAWHLDRLPG